MASSIRYLQEAAALLEALRASPAASWTGSASLRQKKMTELSRLSEPPIRPAAITVFSQRRAFRRSTNIARRPVALLRRLRLELGLRYFGFGPFLRSV